MPVIQRYSYTNCGNCMTRYDIDLAGNRGRHRCKCSAILRTIQMLNIFGLILTHRHSNQGFSGGIITLCKDPRKYPRKYQNCHVRQWTSDLVNQHHRLMSVRISISISGNSQLGCISFFQYWFDESFESTICCFFKLPFHDNIFFIF